MVATRLAQLVLSLALVLTLGTGVTLRHATAQGLPADNATGRIVPGMITIQGIVALDPARKNGSFDYLIDVTASASVAEGYRVAYEGEQRFIAVDAATNQAFAAGSTDANGIAVLDGEVGAAFYIQEIDDPNVPFGTNDIFLPEDGTDPAVSVTAIQYVNSGQPTEQPSAGPTDEPTTGPPSGTVTGTRLADAITVQGLVVKDPERAGQTDYLLNVTAAAEAGDFRAAREGEQTYQVWDIDSETVIDSGSTDANGLVVLDGEVDASYYVVEVDDHGSIPGTDSLYYPNGDPNAYISLTGVRYVADLGAAGQSADPNPSLIDSPSAVASDSPSAVASDSPGDVASDSPASSPSLTGSPSPVASASAGDSPSPVASSSAAASPGASAGASAVPPDQPGVTVTVTLAVAVPDGVTVCLADICQTLGVSAGGATTGPDVARKSARSGLLVAAEIPAGTLVTFNDILPGTYPVTVSLDGVLLFAAEVTVTVSQPVAIVIDAQDRVDDPAGAPDRATADGDGVMAPSVAASRPAAPVVSSRDDVGTLPNTGSGTAPDHSLWSWLALLLAAAGLTAASLAIRRRPS